MKVLTGIKALSIHDQTLNSLIGIFSKNFNDLEVLSIVKCKLKIAYHGLIAPNLKHLSLSDNLLTSFDFDIIKKYQNIRFINLSKNQIIKFSGSLTFDSLKLITLRKNSCVDAELYSGEKIEEALSKCLQF